MIELTTSMAREFANTNGFCYVEQEMEAWLEDIRDQLENKECSAETTLILRGNAETVRNVLSLFAQIKDLDSGE